MLALERNDQEAIVIGNDIRIVVVWSRHGRVRLAIDAPRDIPIFREELINRQRDSINDNSSS